MAHRLPGDVWRRLLHIKVHPDQTAPEELSDQGILLFAYVTQAK